MSPLMDQSRRTSAGDGSPAVWLAAAVLMAIAIVAVIVPMVHAMGGAWWLGGDEGALRAGGAVGAAEGRTGMKGCMVSCFSLGFVGCGRWEA